MAPYFVAEHHHFTSPDFHCVYNAITCLPYSLGFEKLRDLKGLHVI